MMTMLGQGGDGAAGGRGEQGEEEGGQAEGFHGRY
jgi:hypothetical protein